MPERHHINQSDFNRVSKRQQHNRTEITMLRVDNMDANVLARVDVLCKERYHIHIDLIWAGVREIINDQSATGGIATTVSQGLTC